MDGQFIRYASYRHIESWVARRFPSGTGRLNIVEFGGSNGAVARLFPGSAYTVAPNWPQVDLQDLSGYETDRYDVVVVDNVLEHVPEPGAAVENLRRVLRPGGSCIALTPFMVRVHGSPDDFVRYTDAGLRRLFRRFAEVEVFGWGNRFTLETTMRWGWISTRRTRRLLRVALWNEPDCADAWRPHHVLERAGGASVVRRLAAAADVTGRRDRGVRRCVGGPSVGLSAPRRSRQADPG
jgi:SAM-dependent methyltransferase